MRKGKPVLAVAVTGFVFGGSPSWANLDGLNCLDPGTGNYDIQVTGGAADNNSTACCVEGTDCNPNPLVTEINGGPVAPTLIGYGTSDTGCQLLQMAGQKSESMCMSSFLPSWSWNERG